MTLPGDCAGWPGFVSGIESDGLSLATVMTSGDDEAGLCEMIFARSDRGVDIIRICSSDFCVDDSGDVIIWRSE